MEAYEKIIDHETVIDHFGYWPTFHDSEVLSICFQRDHIMDAPGPSLVVKLYAFEMTSEVTEDNFYKIIKHCVITIEFDGVEMNEFNGFNHQNALWGVEVTTGRDIDAKEVIKVELSQSFGVECNFTCRGAYVTSLTAGEPPSHENT